MATARRIELTAEEEQTLRMWTRAGTTEQRLARRARVILCCAQGLRIREVSEQCGLSQISVFKWKKRFLEKRLDGLADEARPGRPASISPAQRLAVVDLATSTPREGKTSWSVKDLAQASGLSSTTVHRILSEAKLRPHKTEYWCGRSLASLRMRCTVVEERPLACARSFTLQEVLPSRGVLVARSTTARRCAGLMLAGRPGRASSARPSRRFSRKRFFHLKTLIWLSPHCSLTSLMRRPCAQQRMTRARRANRCSVVPARVHMRRVCSSSAVSSIRRAVAMNSLLRCETTR